MEDATNFDHDSYDAEAEAEAAALRQLGATLTPEARTAIERVGELRPDVVLLDWMMPELDGPETCRQLKADPATAGIPVVFLTAKSQEAEIQRGLSLGAAGYVTKPFDALSLGQQVKDIVAATTP